MVFLFSIFIIIISETIYVLISFDEHVINVKGAFKLGNMQVYLDLHGTLLAYSADLISDNCLPEALE